PSSLSSGITGVHVHGPAAPGVSASTLFILPPDSFFETGDPVVIVPMAAFDVTPAQVADLKAGRWYFDIHTTTFPGGEIRGQFPPSAKAFRDSLVNGLDATPPSETRATVL